MKECLYNLPHNCAVYGKEEAFPSNYQIPVALPFVGNSSIESPCMCVPAN